MIDLGQARRRAKELLAAAKSGDGTALGRLTVTHGPPRLADAQLATHHLFAITTDGRHAAFWVDGAGYHGRRPHSAAASRWIGPAGDAAGLLVGQEAAAEASLVDLADDARRNLTDEQYFADTQRLLETAYLAALTPQGGSGLMDPPASRG